MKVKLKIHFIPYIIFRMEKVISVNENIIFKEKKE